MQRTSSILLNPTSPLSSLYLSPPLSSASPMRLGMVLQPGSIPSTASSTDDVSSASSSSSSSQERLTPSSPNNNLLRPYARSTTSTNSNRKIRFAPLPIPSRDEDEDEEGFVNGVAVGVKYQNVDGVECVQVQPLDLLDTPHTSVESLGLADDSGRQDTTTDGGETESLNSLSNSAWPSRRMSTTPSSSTSPLAKFKLWPFKGRRAASLGSVGVERSPVMRNVPLSRNSSLDSTASSTLMPLRRQVSTVSTVDDRASITSSLRKFIPLKHVQSELGTSSTSKKPGKGNLKKRSMKGTRMLNGRVYGVKHANPFSTVIDEEPEFVEWGYGGMGSVKNRVVGSKAGTDWSRVQSSGRLFGVAHEEDEDDDPSGMAWVKKRREAREKAAREKAEAEALAAKEPATPTTTTIPPPVTETKAATPAIEVRAPTPAVPAEETTAENEHVVSSVIPSKEHIDGHRRDDSEQPLTESSSSSNSEDEGDGDDEKEREDDEQDQQKRITALSAGMEKISRHKDNLKDHPRE